VKIMPISFVVQAKTGRATSSKSSLRPT
jgi:hypothetical protein